MKSSTEEMFHFDKYCRCTIMYPKPKIDFVRYKEKKEVFKVHIATLMPNISTNGCIPTMSKIYSKGRGVFVSETKPSVTSNILIVKNYLNVKHLNYGQIRDYIRTFPDCRFIKYIITRGTVINGKFDNNKLSQLSAEILMTDGYINQLKDPLPI